MKKEELEQAMFESERFLEKAKNGLEKIDWNSCGNAIYPSKYSSEIKRSSMDLTRALSDLRRRSR